MPWEPYKDGDGQVWRVKGVITKWDLTGAEDAADITDGTIDVDVDREELIRPKRSKDEGEWKAELLLGTDPLRPYAVAVMVKNHCLGYLNPEHALAVYETAQDIFGDQPPVILATVYGTWEGEYDRDIHMDVQHCLEEAAMNADLAIDCIYPLDNPRLQWVDNAQRINQPRSDFNLPEGPQRKEPARKLTPQEQYAVDYAKWEAEHGDAYRAQQAAAAAAAPVQPAKPRKRFGIF